jgi:hypothetical protein
MFDRSRVGKKVGAILFDVTVHYFMRDLSEPFCVQPVIQASPELHR